MRKLILAVVPVLALSALPALAQSSVSQSTTTTTTAVPPPVQTNETVTKKTYSNDGATAQHTESERQVTTNGAGQVDMSKTQHHVETNGPDGSHSESSSQTTTTGPN
jgi:hypothetical protein